MKHFTEIDPGHPTLEGHFPGHPIVPGVVILDQVIAAFKRERGGSCHVHKIPSVKFLSPLEPGVRIEFRFELSNDHALFTGICDEKIILSGQLEFSPVP